MQPKISIFIPIKKDSQRVLGKNYRDFGGIPLWEHTVRKFSNFDVYVDTDDPALITSLKSYPNVIAYLRSPALLGHKVSVCDLIKHWVYRFNPEGFLFQSHVTSPFIKTDTLLAAFSQMTEANDSIFSCTRYQTRFWHLEKPVNHNPDVLIQTQDLESVYEENSLFYGFTKEVAETGKRIGNTPMLYVTGQAESMDIDTEEDWEKCLKIIQQVK